jgi:hypothetical protein
MENAPVIVPSKTWWVGMVVASTLIAVTPVPAVPLTKAPAVIVFAGMGPGKVAIWKRDEVHHLMLALLEKSAVPAASLSQRSYVPATLYWVPGREMTADDPAEIEWLRFTAYAQHVRYYPGGDGVEAVWVTEPPAIALGFRRDSGSAPHPVTTPRRISATGLSILGRHGLPTR